MKLLSHAAGRRVVQVGNGLTGIKRAAEPWNNVEAVYVRSGQSCELPTYAARQDRARIRPDVDPRYTRVWKYAARGHSSAHRGDLGSRRMCGIVGIYCKSPAVGDQLGHHLGR